MTTRANHRRTHHPVLALAAALVWLLGIGLGAASAGPPFAERVDGQAVYDNAGILSADTEEYGEQIAGAVEAQTGAEVVVYTQTGLLRLGSGGGRGCPQVGMGRRPRRVG